MMRGTVNSSLTRLSLFRACLLWPLVAAAGEVWTDTTFEDFSRGKFDAAGQNLYVSRDGTIRTVHRFDLNRDGYLDLVFNSTHDYSYFLPAVVASAQGAAMELPVEGSNRVVVDDLNRDGFADAVFCPSDSGLQNPRRYLKIAWGAADGFSPARISGVLPVYGAIAAAIADLNGDGWPDIVTLNQKAWLRGQEAGNVVRVYWGAPHGFQPGKFRDFGVSGAVDLTRLNPREVAVLTRDSVRILPGSAEIALGTTNARTIAAVPDGRLVVGTETRTLLATRGLRTVATLDQRPAAHAAIGDLDADGRPDAVFTDARGVRVLWNLQGVPTEISLAQAAAAAVLDFNQDGKLDLAIAIQQSETRLETESLVYLGLGSHGFARGPGFKTSGAMHAAAVSAGPGRPPRVIFAGSRGGTVAEKVPIYVYWGGAAGFSANQRWEIPLQSGYESSAADLNADGWPELIVLNSGHVGGAADGEPTLGANILWGSAAGFDFNRRRTVLAEADIGSSTVADLDRDGYLDIVLGAFDTAQKRDRLVIYYGGPNGFSKQRRQALIDSGRAVSLTLGDFDQDGWLDIAAADFPRERVVIFSGSARGFEAARMTAIAVPSAISLETADLNADGRLDLIVGSYQDRESGTHDGGTYLFWGSASGFGQANSQWLPGFAPIGPAVADFDADGFLDLFTPHYLGNGTRESLPSYLYWGSPEGFHPRRRTALITDSAHDALAADFDGDGRLDLAVSCHTTDGDHYAASKIFFNDGHRFASPRVQSLPTIGPHWMWDQDMGHIATRAWKQTYESRVFAAAAVVSRFTWEVESELPVGAQVEFSARWAATPAALAAAPWNRTAGPLQALDAGARFVQYRLTLVSPDGERYPSVKQVRLSFD